ncbi:helix-turn-helix domain-containing protein [Spirillospora sp. CA-255316]
MPGTVMATARTEFDRGTAFGLHVHPFHLLSWSETATVTHRTADRDWLVPPTHALWMPAGVPHAVAVVRGGRGYGVILNARHTPWTEPTGVLVTPLVRELIVHLDRHPERSRARAEALLVELLEPVSTTTFQLPIPTDPRLRDITEALLADPADDRDLAAWADHAATSVRTVTRLFQAETGMTFAQWRTHARIRAALTHLADGAPVRAAARAVGYRKPAAFAEAFRRVTGQLPSAYSAP